MKLKIKYRKEVFQFKTPSGTSRGVLTEKKSWFITINDSEDPSVFGVGECSVIPGLSPDYENDDQYQSCLDKLCSDPNMNLDHLPSIKFGLEMALLDLRNGSREIFFENDFIDGKRIPINGLIWMGNSNFMREQIKDKIGQGFKTIKMKIGAIDFESEIKLLEDIRSQYPEEKLTLRVDANGAFDFKKAMDKLVALSALKIHSIEQPIRAGNWQEMAILCKSSPVPIALDEELIGVNNVDEKIELLDVIGPQFIILKPSLHGGIDGVRKWITLAEERGIGWWITSALESNLGLKAICQLTAEYDNDLPQGLGTGSLYVNNLKSNLIVQNGYIFQTNE